MKVYTITESFLQIAKEKDSDLQKEYLHLVERVESIILSQKEIISQVDYLLRESIFNTRIKAFNQLNRSPYYIINEISEFVDSVESDYDTLRENLLFALRSQKKVITAILNMQSSSNFERQTTSEGVTYRKIIDSILETSFKPSLQIDFIDTTIYIEFVLIAFLLITEKKIILQDKSRYELEYISATYTHNYLSYAHQLGVLEFKDSKIFKTDFFEKEIVENQSIADENLDELSRQ